MYTHIICDELLCSFRNQLADLKAATLVILCATILRNSLIPDKTFLLDVNKMQSSNLQPQKIKLYFDYETQFNYQPYEGYPCYGKDSSNISSQNRKYFNMFLLSSGPQENTLFLFSYLSNENHYMITSFIANVNFNKFYHTESIFEKYKPNLSGPSAAPGPTELSAPSINPDLFRPGVPPTPQINSMPLAPPEHYRLPHPSSQYQPPMHPTPPGQFPFPAPSTTSAVPTFFMPSQPSTRYTFPAYQAAPAAPSKPSVPSSSHTLPVSSGSSAADKSEHLNPSDT